MGVSGGPQDQPRSKDSPEGFTGLSLCHTPRHSFIAISEDAGQNQQWERVHGGRSRGNHEGVSRAFSQCNHTGCTSLPQKHKAGSLETQDPRILSRAGRIAALPGVDPNSRLPVGSRCAPEAPSSVRASGVGTVSRLVQQGAGKHPGVRVSEASQAPHCKQASPGTSSHN